MFSTTPTNLLCIPVLCGTSISAAPSNSTESAFIRVPSTASRARWSAFWSAWAKATPSRSSFPTIAWDHTPPAVTKRKYAISRSSIAPSKTWTAAAISSYRARFRSKSSFRPSPTPGDCGKLRNSKSMPMAMPNDASTLPMLSTCRRPPSSAIYSGLATSRPIPESKCADTRETNPIPISICAIRSATAK